MSSIKNVCIYALSRDLDMNILCIHLKTVRIIRRQMLSKDLINPTATVARTLDVANLLLHRFQAECVTAQTLTMVERPGQRVQVYMYLHMRSRAAIMYVTKAHTYIHIC
jgi:hypothetical protein